VPRVEDHLFPPVAPLQTGASNSKDPQLMNRVVTKLTDEDIIRANGVCRLAATVVLCLRGHRAFAVNLSAAQQTEQRRKDAMPNVPQLHQRPMGRMRDRKDISISAGLPRLRLLMLFHRAEHGPIPAKVSAS
jgi:hypothetical protein